MRGRTETIVGVFILAALGVFLYMGFRIGSFRFDRDQYASYTMFFKDTRVDISYASQIALDMKNFVFTQFPDVNSLVVVCHKKSFGEQDLLKQFGFEESALVSNEYDSMNYVSFELVREN